MTKTKVDFLEGRLLSSQSQQFKKFSKSTDWLEKSWPSKKATFVWSCKQAIYKVSTQTLRSKRIERLQN